MGEKFVQNIRAFRTQTREKGRPAAIGSENAREELEGRLGVHALPPRRNPFGCDHPAFAFARAAPERAVKRLILRPFVGEREQIVLVQSQKGRFKRGRERQIIVRVEHDAADRH